MEQLRPGDLIDRYEVVEEIGRGASGTVFVARDPSLGRDVALKLLSGGTSAAAERKLLREAQLMAQLSHSNVVTVHEVGQSDRGVYIAMELVRGTTLTKWLGDEHRDWSAVLARLIAAGDGLAAAHRAGIVHGDFKPDNVLVSDDGRVLVTDFGLARAALDLTETSSAGASDLETAATQTDGIRGTPRFMAPELLDGEAASRSSDQFAFGVSLYAALYESYPFPGQSVGGLLESLERPPLPPPARPGIPGALWSVVRRCLQARPRDRFAEVDEAMAALRTIAGSPRRKRRLIALAAVCFAGLTVGTALAWADNRSCGPGDERLAGVWDPARATRLADAMARGVSTQLGAQTGARVSAQLDAYAREWSGAQRALCEAAREDAGPGANIDAKATCLERCRIALRVLVDGLTAEPDVATIERASAAATQLPKISDCEQPDAVQVGSLSPEIEEGFLRAETLASLGPATEGLELASELLELELPPRSKIRALLLLSRFEYDLGRLDEARTHAKEASELAADAGDDRLMAQASLDLSRSMIFALRHVEARAQLDAARVAVRRLGDPPELAYRVALGERRLASGEERYTEAIAAARTALAFAEEIGRPRDPILRALALDLSNIGRYEEALAALDLAADLVREEVGETHPRYAGVVHMRGKVLTKWGRLDEAGDHLRLALDVMTRAVGPDEPRVADILYAVAVHEVRAGEYPAVVEHLERVLDIYRRNGGVPAGLDAVVHDTLAHTYVEIGDTDAARAAAAHGVALAEKTLGRDHPRYTTYVTTRGLVEYAAGNMEAALADYEFGLERTGPEARDRIHILHRVAQLRVALGKPGAKPLIEEAIALTSASEVSSLAYMRFILAQTVHAQGDHARAEKLATESEKILREGTLDEQSEADEVRDWLASR